VSLLSPGGLTILDQHASLWLRKRTTNEWKVNGSV
jgi:hypothetical protein